MNPLDTILTPLLGGIFTLLGCAEIGIARVVLGKKLEKLEAEIQTTINLDKKTALEQQAKGVAIVVKATQGAGLFFVALGIYGLTR